MIKKNHLVIYLLLSQVVFYVFAKQLFVGRTIVNIDYFFVLLVLAFRRYTVAWVLFVIAMLSDVFMIVVQILPFTRLQDFFYFLGKINAINYEYVVYIALVVIITILSGFILIKLAKKNSKESLLIYFNIFIFAFFTASYMHEDTDENRFYRVASVPVIDSVFLYALNYRGDGFVESTRLKEQEFSESLYKSVFCEEVGCDTPQADKVLFIVNESWGVYKNNDINTHFSNYLGDKVKIKSGISSFRGPTVSAELKELCGLKSSSFYLVEAEEEELKDCLPNIYQKAGWETMAYHGAASAMYDRAYWYPKVGFNQSLFYENSGWKSRCYSFPGACDIEISKTIIQDIQHTDKGFFYWLTLNTHYNYNPKDLTLEVEECADFDITNSEVCANFKLQNQFFKIVQKMMSELEHEDILVVIVGDHTPPIVKGDKEEYFHTGKVPWLVIHSKAKE